MILSSQQLTKADHLSPSGCVSGNNGIAGNFYSRVVQLLQDGTSICAIPRRFAVSPSTVSRAWRRYQGTGHYTRRAVQGHRRATTQQQGWYLLLSARRNRRRTGRAYKMTSSRILMCRFLTKLSGTDFMRDL